jgi:HNH endonuclease
MFGLGNTAKALYGGEDNRLHNVITMAINLHSAFDSFNLWLEPLNQYLDKYVALFTPLFSI